MKETDIKLDIVFINEELEVIAVHQGIPHSEELITEQDVAYVLEVNVNSDIKKGDELEFSPEKKVNSAKMHVLDENGNSQMQLNGGERIVSRYETKTLIKKAKRASAMQTDNGYKSLGKYIFKVLDGQASRDPEFVKGKE